MIRCTKLFKKKRLLAGVGLILAGLTLIGIFFLHEPSRELTRTEMQKLLEAGALSQAQVTPTPYSGIYRVEAHLKRGGRTEKAFITTHLDESQVKMIFSEAGVKVEMPGSGMRGQW